MSPSLGSVHKLCWTGYFGLLVGGVLTLQNHGLSRTELCPTPLIMGGQYASVPQYSCQLTWVPITIPVILTVSSELVLAQPTYQKVNAGLCDYKKKPQKMKIQSFLSPLRNVHLHLA